MGCVFFLIALILPRLCLFFIWLLTNWFVLAFRSTIWPLLGFCFMPYTTLAYMAGMLNDGSIQGGWLVLVIVAVLVDLGHTGGAARARR